MPSWEAQVQTKHPADDEGEERHAQEQEHEKCGHLAARAQQRSPVPFVTFIVMPLDGEEHGYAQRQKLERNEDDWDPIHNKYLHVNQLRAL